MCLNILGLNIAKLSLLAFVNGPRMNFIFNLEGHVFPCFSLSCNKCYSEIVPFIPFQKLFYLSMLLSGSSRGLIFCFKPN